MPATRAWLERDLGTRDRVLEVPERHHHLGVRLEERLAVLAVEQLGELVGMRASALRNAISSSPRAANDSCDQLVAAIRAARPPRRPRGAVTGTVPTTSPVAGS